MQTEEFKMFRSNADKAERIDNNNLNHPIRDKFDRDRDRIMYCKPFRRLSGKTQVFLASKDDHVRNRLTHTLEVSQIARTIAKAVGLNEVLVEAIALGHDIGHTPFGHVGERTLDKIMSGCYELEGFTDAQMALGNTGFKHNWQSVKVATIPEENLNLTTVTLWGMLNHSKVKYGVCRSNITEDGKKICYFRRDKQKECTYSQENELSYYKQGLVERSGHLLPLSEFLIDEECWSFEAYIVAIADEIAQRHHDIEDAIENKIFSKQELIQKLKERLDDCLKQNSAYYKQERVQKNKCWLESWEAHSREFNTLEISKDGERNKIFIEDEKFISTLSKFLVNLLTTDVIYNTQYILRQFKEKYEIAESDQFEDIKKKLWEEVKDNHELFSPLMKSYDEQLEELLKNRVLNSYQAQKMDGMGQYIIRELFKAYIVNPQQLPNKSVVCLFNNYYRMEYKCSYRSALQNDGLKEGDIGKMRDELEKLHFRKEDLTYKIALLRTICDYIAGMTDKYAMEKHKQLYNIEYR